MVWRSDVKLLEYSSHVKVIRGPGGIISASPAVVGVGDYATTSDSNLTVKLPTVINSYKKTEWIRSSFCNTYMVPDFIIFASKKAEVK